jgi:hypothetical protein
MNSATPSEKTQSIVNIVFCLLFFLITILVTMYLMFTDFYEDKDLQIKVFVIMLFTGVGFVVSFILLIKRKKYLKSLFTSIFILLMIGLAIFSPQLLDFFKGTDRLLSELESNDQNIRLKAFSILNKRGNLTVKHPENIDWIVSTCSIILNNNGEWIDQNIAKEYYWTIKKIDNNLIIESLVRHLFKPALRLRALFLSIKLGIPGTVEKLNDILIKNGDKSMAEDFLNSGSEELHNCGQLWASSHGYLINTGLGSHRASWGRF